MEVFKSSDKVVVKVKINGSKVSEFSVHTNDFLVNPSMMVGCINNCPSCTDKMTQELVDRIEKALAFRVINELLWQKGKIEQILDDAFAIAPTNEIEQEIVSMGLQLLPLVEQIYDPATNLLSKTDIKKFKPFKTHDSILSFLFSESFMDLGIMTFSAKVER